MVAGKFHLPRQGAVKVAPAAQKISRVFQRVWSYHDLDIRRGRQMMEYGDDRIRKFRKVIKRDAEITARKSK